jgi:hypothetical protein
MQLDYRRVQVRNACGEIVVSYDILRDGVVLDNVPTKSVAFQRMDAIWATRPLADRVAEQLYTGD